MGEDATQHSIDPETYIRVLTRLTGADLNSLVIAIERRRGIDDDMAWWHATMALERGLRRTHRLRRAATAARIASEAVFAAARRARRQPDDPDILVVARAASEVARALVAGDADLRVFLRSWEAVRALSASAPRCPPPAAA
jgi:hypothetical protein